MIYKYALDQMPREQVPELYRDFIGFEKRHGSVQGIEEVSWIRSVRREKVKGR